MSSKTMPEAAPYRSPLGQESAPSELREDKPAVARFFGLAGLVLIFAGAAVLFFNSFSPRWITPLWGQVFIILGLTALLFHAARDADVQIRRSYGVFGLGLVALAVVASLLPFREAGVGALFLPWGAVGYLLGLFFLLPFARHEDDPFWRRVVLLTLVGVGAALAAVGFVGG